MNAVVLSWSFVDGDDDAGIAAATAVYVVTSAASETERIERIDDAVDTATVSGLRNGVEYAFTVYAATVDGRSAGAGPVTATPTTGADGEVAGLIVAFADGTDVAVGDSEVPGADLVEDVALEVTAQVTDDAMLVALSEPVSVDAAESIATDLAADPAVAWAEPDIFMFTAGDDLAQPVAVPGDADYAEQWNLWDTYGIGVGDSSSSMTSAWATGKGAGATVAVIDTGIAPHADLDANLVPGYDFVSNPDGLATDRDGSGSPVDFDADATDPARFGPLGRDDNPTDPGDWRGVAPTRDSSWHGTAMAGIIAAQANADGITGIAPEAKIEPVRALSWRGGLLSDIAASITWASGGTVPDTPVNANPADVINLSFAVQTSCPVALQAAITDARARGSVLVAAAGNANMDANLFAPGNCDGVITVAATGRDGQRAAYSNYGPRIDLAAPGDGVLATSNPGLRTPEATVDLDGNRLAPSYATQTGTSVAAAHVSGAIALLKARNTALTPDDIEAALTGSVRSFANNTFDTDPTKTGGTGILNLAQIAAASSPDVDTALALNGSNQGALTSATTALNVSNAFTLEAWVKPTSCNGQRLIIDRNESYALACVNGVWWGASGSWWAWVNSGISARMGEWQHVAVTRAASTNAIKFYVDGQLAAEKSTTASGNQVPGTGAIPSNSSVLSIGYRAFAGDTGYNFNGQIDEVRVFNTARSDSEIATDMKTWGDRGALAYYDFNAASGPTVLNRATNAAAATNLFVMGGAPFNDVKLSSLSGSDMVLTFPRSYLTSVGGWRVPSGVTSAKALVVAGGGGGGGRHGGGGGAGGLVDRYSTGSVALTSGQTYGVTVGQGGRGAPSSQADSRVNDARNGQDSVAFGLTSVGGGAGSGQANGAAGGSGGGGAVSGSGGAASPSGQGNAGGSGSVNSGWYWGGGGGGGAGGAGMAASSSAGGAGGPGLSVSITGLASTYAAGGNGGFATGNNCAYNGANGVAGTGNGGTGVSGGGDCVGGAGGSGVVIVRYASSASSACSPQRTVYVSGGTTYRVYSFTDPGTCAWTVPAGATSADVLVVGAGGGGGSDGGSGGGGGGMRQGTGVAVVPGGTASITVGTGGNGGLKNPAVAASAGAASTLIVNSLTFTGGGGGAGLGWGSSSTAQPGGAGGTSSGSGTGSNGATGGLGPASNCSNDLVQGTVGGNGPTSSITGSPTNYGGGGGGGAEANAQLSTSASAAGKAGGAGGGGAGAAWDLGARRFTAGQPGADGLGGGGGAGAACGDGSVDNATWGTRTQGGSGGSGVVIISVSTPSVCVPTSTVSGTSTVVEFRESGSCSWTRPAGVRTIDYLVVGGGGGGGADGGAGGGGGAMFQALGVPVGAGVSALDVTVGAGGVGATYPSTSSTSGGDSAITIAGECRVGGGGGGGIGTGASGGAGGVGKWGCAATTGAAGGSGASTAVTGGSAGTPGANGTTLSLTGVTYGGGGGGGVYPNGATLLGPLAGGNGGGGSGAAATATSVTAPGDGADGLGGGGGAGQADADGTPARVSGARGGDGTVIVRYSNLPDVPTAVTATATDPNEITLSWTAPVHQGASAVTGYRVQQSTTSGSGFADVTTGTCASAAPTSNATSCTITALAAGSTYYFTVSATNDSGVGAASSQTTSVVPFGPLDHFAVTSTSGGAIATQTAGTAFAMKAVAQDSGNRTVLSFTGTAAITSTSTITAGTTTAAFTAGGLSSHSVTLTRAGTGQTVTVTGSAKSGTSAAFTIVAGAATNLQTLLPGETSAPATTTGKTGTPSVQVAGTAFDVVVNAVDANWNVVTTATPTVAITTTSTLSDLPANAALVAGTKTFSTKLNAVGTWTVTATDQAGSPLAAGPSASVSVGPGAASAVRSTLTTSTASMTADGSATATLTVQAKDAYGNDRTTGGATVAITRSSGSGSLSAVTDNGDGTYTATVTAPSIVGTGTFTATLGGSAVQGGTGATQQVVVSYVAGSATTIAVNAGNSQSATVGTAVGTSPSVVVTDANGNPVSGVSVTFAVATGGGSLGSPATVTTNSSGIATAPAWTLGTTAGSNTLTATSGSLAGSPVTFTATGSSDSADHFGIARNGSGTLPAGWSQELTITAVDQYGNVATGYAGTKSLTFGGASTSPGGDAPTVVDASGTDRDFGVATDIAFTAGVASIAGSGSMAYNGRTTLYAAETAQITATAGAITTPTPLSITVDAGSQTSYGLSASATTLTTTQRANLTVKALDQYGNTVPSVTGNVTVYFAGLATAPNGDAPTVVDRSMNEVPLGQATSLSFAAGVASVSGSGSMASNGVLHAVKVQTASLTVANAASNPTITSNALAVTVSPGYVWAATSTLTASAATLTADGTSTSTLTVQAKDPYGNDRTTGGDTVAITRIAGSGSVSAVSDNNNGTYTATVTAPSILGTGTFTATLGGSAVQGGTGSTQQAVISYVAGAATTIAVNAGDNQSATVGTAVATSPSVLVTDANGNPVAGVSVTFAVATGGGSLGSPATVTTNSSGIVTAPAWTLGTTAGSNTLTATSGSLSGSPVTFTATGTSGGATKVLFSTQPVAGASGATMTTQPVVRIADASGNTVMTDSTTQVTLTASAGSLGGTTTVTAVNGVATFSGLTFAGLTTGSYSLTASATSLTSATSSTFTPTSPGTPTALSVTTQPNGAVYGQALSTQPVVQLRDSAGNAVSQSGVTIAADTATGTGNLSNPSTTTDANGTATFSGLSLIGTAGAFTLEFTAPALLNVSPITSSSFTLTKRTQTVTFGALANATYGDPSFTLPGTASSGLTVGYASSDPAVCSVAGSILTVTGAGSCIITASQAGNVEWSAAADVQRTLQVDRAAQATLTMSSPSSAVYGQTIALAATGGSGSGTVSFSVTSPLGAGKCSLSGTTLTLGDAGSLCKVQATKAADANYLLAQSTEQTIAIARAGNVLAFTSTVPTTPLPSGTYTPTVSSTSAATGSATDVTPTLSIAAGSSGVCSVSNGTVTFQTTGTCVVEASALQTTNFSAASTVTQTIAVGSLNQTITFTQPSNRTYGSASLAMQASASSGLTVAFARGGGTTNNACTVSSGGVVTVVAVGVCEVTASQAGDSQYAPASDVTRRFNVVADLPAAPLISSVSGGDQSATVAFSVPNYTGGAAITAYQVTAVSLAGGPTVTTSACSPSASPLACTVTGLVNGDAYQLSVAAINAAGTGPDWLAGTQVTPATAPFAVSGLSVVPGDTTLLVSWAPLTVAQLGGGTFTRYEVAYRVSGTSAWTTWTTALTSRTMATTTITGLSNGNGYDVKVVAVTSANNAEIAGNTATVIGFPAAVPSPPLAVTALAATATDLQVSWQAPMANGGAPLVSPFYTVSITSTNTGAASPIACTFATPGDTFCTATGLTNGALYAVAVTAMNRMGASLPGTTTYAVPSADATLSALDLASGGSPISLSPAFASSTFAYTASVPNAVAAVEVTATPTSGGATVEVDGAPVANGVASSPIPLAVGSTTITVVVTASDPRFTQTTTVVVTRAAAPVIDTDDAGGSTSGSGRYLPPAGSVQPIPVGVVAGTVTSAVVENGVPVAASQTRNSTDSGWTLTTDGFTMGIATTTAASVPVQMTGGGVLRLPAGGIVQTSGSGFLPGSQIAAILVPRTMSRVTSALVAARGLASRAGGSSDVYLGSAAVGADGEVQAVFTTPAALALGDYVLQVNGVTTEGDTRSIDLAVDVVAPTVSRVGTARAAGFFAPLSARLSADGTQRLARLVSSIPAGASDVKVSVVGVSVSMGSAAANVALAAKRAQAVVDYLTAHSVDGDYSIDIHVEGSIGGRVLTFDDSGSLVASQPSTTVAGKPLTTATATFTTVTALT